MKRIMIMTTILAILTGLNIGLLLAPLTIEKTTLDQIQIWQDREQETTGRRKEARQEVSSSVDPSPSFPLIV